MVIEIKVFGSGCAKCNKLASLASEAFEEEGIKYNLIKVEDPVEILDAGIFSTPGLMIDKKIFSQGKIPRKNKLIELIQGLTNGE